MSTQAPVNPHVRTCSTATLSCTDAELPSVSATLYRTRYRPGRQSPVARAATLHATHVRPVGQRAATVTVMSRVMSPSVVSLAIAAQPVPVKLTHGARLTGAAVPYVRKSDWSRSACTMGAEQLQTARLFPSQTQTPASPLACSVARAAYQRKVAGEVPWQQEQAGRHRRLAAAGARDLIV